jgi:hypothetical protein
MRENHGQMAYMGVAPTPDGMGVFPVRLDLSGAGDADRSGSQERLRSAGGEQVQDHDCSVHGEPAVLVDSESFAARARKLVTRGFKPKDAAQITLQEITFENRNDPKAASKAQADAEDFLRRVKDGLI